MGRMFDNAAVRYPVMPNLSFYAQRELRHFVLFHGGEANARAQLQL
jgi:hypothetical protein